MLIRPLFYKCPISVIDLNTNRLASLALSATVSKVGKARGLPAYLGSARLSVMVSAMLKFISGKTQGSRAA